MKNHTNIKGLQPLFGTIVLYAVIMILHKFNIIDSYILQVIMFVGVNMIMTLSLNIATGIAGQACLGHAGFMSLGAYGSAIVTSLIFKGYAVPKEFQIPVFLLGLLAGGLIAALFGLIIGFPTLKIKGDYLAIVTLAFGEVVRATLRLIEPLGAARGMINIPMYSNLAWIMVFLVITLFVSRNFIYSSYGRACLAVRENEIAASAMAVNIAHYKILAFVFAAFIAGVAGGLYAHIVSFIQPDTFSFAKSSDYVVYLYAGGCGTLTGSMVGALILTALPEALRFLDKWRIVLYALILLCVMIFRPKGLCGGKELPFLRLERKQLYAASEGRNAKTKETEERT